MKTLTEREMHGIMFIFLEYNRKFFIKDFDQQFSFLNLCSDLDKAISYTHKLMEEDFNGVGSKENKWNWHFNNVMTRRYGQTWVDDIIKIKDEMVLKLYNDEHSNLKLEQPQTMAKYKKKPIVIEATHFTQDVIDGYCSGKRDLPNGVKHRLGPDNIFNPLSKMFVIETLEGNMEVSLNDWIITGINGEHYPCKPDIFDKTYERVEE